jgi:DNA topoisomerase-1
MGEQKPLFDFKKAREMVVKGRRAKWWQRKGTMKRGFTYVKSDGTALVKKEAIDRIKALVIPPAWAEVRISPAPSSKIQAVGIDTTGRIQYLYNPKFAERQQRKKFAKIERFGEYLPQFRKTTNEHIALDGFPREKVLAIMMRLINSLYIRLGSEKSATHYKTFGITTLQNRHLDVGSKGKLTFDFVGKSHIKHRKVMVDEELATLMRELKDLGAKRKLFNYIGEDGKPHPVKPGDINRYIKAATAPEFSSKDFRTWGGTMMAAVQLAEIGCCDDERTRKKNIVQAVKKVADELGNTPAVCRGSYIHPSILKYYEKGITIDEFRAKTGRKIKRIQQDYEPEERALLKLFQNSGAK